MFEYANVDALVVFVVMGVLAVVLNKLKKKKSSGLGFIEYILIISFIILIWDSYSKYTAGKENIQSFKNMTHTLKCHSGGGAYSSPTYYRVSKNDGWSLSKNYFFKDSLMISVDNCEDY